jgi:hypothetical protein
MRPFASIVAHQVRSAIHVTGTTAPLTRSRAVAYATSPAYSPNTRCDAGLVTAGLDIETANGA